MEGISHSGRMWSPILYHGGHARSQLLAESRDYECVSLWRSEGWEQNSTESSLPAKLTLAYERHRSIAMEVNCTSRLPELHTQTWLIFQKLCYQIESTTNSMKGFLKQHFKTTIGRQQLVVQLQKLIICPFLFLSILACMHAYAFGNKGRIIIKLINTFLVYGHTYSLKTISH